MSDQFDLIAWQQKQLTQLRASVRDYQQKRDAIEKMVAESEWRKPHAHGAIYADGVPVPLAASAMSSLEQSAYWLNQIILHLTRTDAEMVKNIAALIEANAKKEEAVS